MERIEDSAFLAVSPEAYSRTNVVAGRVGFLRLKILSVCDAYSCIELGYTFTFTDGRGGRELRTTRRMGPWSRRLRSRRRRNRRGWELGRRDIYVLFDCYLGRIIWISRRGLRGLSKCFSDLELVGLDTLRFKS